MLKTALYTICTAISNLQLHIAVFSEVNEYETLNTYVVNNIAVHIGTELEHTTYTVL